MPKTFTFKWLGMAPWWVSDAVVMAGTVPGAVVGAVVMAGMAGLTPDPRETQEPWRGGPWRSGPWSGGPWHSGPWRGGAVL